jgi:hypothetical protein
MKIPSTTATPIVAVIVLCALSTGGQQQQSDKGKQQTPDFIPAAPKQWKPVRYRNATLPDGRIVAFPASTSEQEIDALAKRIAEGAVELPPGARVIGWEPVEGADLLLPGYEQRVATIPTMKGKLDALANAMGNLQTQISGMKIDIQSAKMDSNYASNQLLHYAKVLDDHTDLINQAGVLAALANDQGRNAEQESNDLKREAEKMKQELDDLKALACSALYPADVGWTTRMKIKSACGLQ